MAVGRFACIVNYAAGKRQTQLHIVGSAQPMPIGHFAFIVNHAAGKRQTQLYIVGSARPVPVGRFAFIVNHAADIRQTQLRIVGSAQPMFVKCVARIVNHASGKRQTQLRIVTSAQPMLVKRFARIVSHAAATRQASCGNRAASAHKAIIALPTIALAKRKRMQGNYDRCAQTPVLAALKCKACHPGRVSRTAHRVCGRYHARRRARAHPVQRAVRRCAGSSRIRARLRPRSATAAARW